MMRIISILCGVILIATPTFASSEYVDVSAGEHKDFSRIVIEKGVSTEDIDRNGNLIRINGVDPSIKFGFQQINDKQKAYRVAAARAISVGSKSAIEITLRCACEVRTSTLSNGKFVLDIFDAAPAPLTPVSTPIREAPKPIQKPNQTIVTKEDRLSVEQAHKQMVELLKQAAREGLVTIKDGDKGAATKTLATAPVPLTERETPNTTEPSFETAAITDIPDTKPTIPVEHTPEESTATQPTAKCLADAAFLIDAEEFEKDPLVSIADLQATLADPDPAEAKKSVHALARGYLSIGFGEEALSLLNDYDEADTLIADMSRIVAERPLQKNSRLLNSANCDGAHALWQALASNPTAASSLYKRSNGALTSLPSRLKLMLATRLAMKMMEAGDWTSTQQLADLMSAEQETPSRELEYILARIEQNNGENETSRDALLKIAKNNSETADEALLALAESYLKNNETPHDGFTEDIGALAKVHASTKATLAEAIAWANVGNIDAALMLFERVAETSPEDLSLVRTMAQAAFDKAFSSEDNLLQLAALDSYLAHQDWLQLDLSNHVLRDRIAIVARHVGLPNITIALMANTPDSADIEILREKTAAALEAGDTKMAIQTAAPHTEDAFFGEMIVKAKLQERSYHEALASAATLQDENKRASLTGRAAWLARSWRSVVSGFRTLDPNLLTEDTAFYFALASYMANETSIPSTIDAVLSKEKNVLASGIKHFFETTPQGTPLQRGRSHVERAREEILMIEEVLSDG